MHVFSILQRCRSFPLFLLKLFYLLLFKKYSVVVIKPDVRSESSMFFFFFLFISNSRQQPEFHYCHRMIESKKDRKKTRRKRKDMVNKLWSFDSLVYFFWFIIIYVRSLSSDAPQTQSVVYENSLFSHILTE